MSDADSRPTTVIVSGYFNPFHIGHLRLLQAAAEAGDRLVVIVNNDVQQRMKKGRIIMTESDRREIVAAIGIVDEAVIAVDDDRTVIRTIEQIAQREQGSRLVFGNGGDRDSAAVVPEQEVCDRYGIEMVFDMGGTDKADSSTRITSAMSTG
ncbi:adenylyltransferase/cytidyltransferase family protein [Euzebya sp.]|uniref:adenylyltransferase/cytidyltransferase family protein n=1 Tax=Euzebya sp. TaxID=1971409 RepID=UPI0035195773